MEELTWDTLGIIVGALAGLVTVLYRAPKAFRQLGKWWGSMFGIGDIKTDLAALSDQMNVLMNEFSPNGGSSMRDLMNRVEKELFLSNERQRARMLDAPEMIFETDDVGNCIWVNRTYSRAVGRSLTELLGRGWVNGIVETDREKVVDEWYKSVEEDREFELTFDFQTAEGTPFTVECRSYKMRDLRTGQAVGYLGHCQKI